MAINVNVISENKAFTVENANYCTVALPITACWGPGFTLPTANPSDSSNSASTLDDALENTAWSLFNAGPDGLESFIATYRGPSSNYRSTKDYSYFMALSLLNAGYAVQTCRLCPGTKASLTLPEGSSSGSNGSGSLIITAKYPGTFGNSLKVTLTQKSYGTMSYWNLIGYAVDSTGASRPIENLVFVFNPEDSTDSIYTIDELQSKFFDFKVVGTINENEMATTEAKVLAGGSDVADASSQDASAIMADAIALAEVRYGSGSSAGYLFALNSVKDLVSKTTAEAIRFNEWVYRYVTGSPVDSATGVNSVYDLLKDKINYNPNRVISPWDDHDILAIDPNYDVSQGMYPSPLTLELLEVSTRTTCGFCFIDQIRGPSLRFFTPVFLCSFLLKKLQRSETRIKCSPSSETQ